MKIALMIVTANVLLGVGNLTDNPISEFANLGAVAVLSAVLVWIVMKGTPAIYAAHREERDALLARLECMETRRHEDSERLRETLDKMLAHCMAERG